MDTKESAGKKTRFETIVEAGSLPAVDPKTINWDKLGFGPMTTAFIGGSVAGADGVFEPFRLAASGCLRLPPSATVLNYAQGIFEGIKARRGVDGKARIFRLMDNCARMKNGAARMMLSPFSDALFRETVVETVRANIEYIPPVGKGSLYIRPLLMGVGPTLAIAASPETLFTVYVIPVGLYFKGLSCISIKVCDDFIRAPEKGVGRVKAFGNYGACFLPGAQAKAAGFAELLFLDHEGKRIEEVGTANFCAVKGKKLLVADSPAVLQGITRDSVMRIAKERLGMEVEMGPIALDRILGLGDWKAEGPADEVFCTGTAAIVSPIGSLTSLGVEHVFGAKKPGPVTVRIHDELDGIQTGKLPDEYGWVTFVD